MNKYNLVHFKDNVIRTARDESGDVTLYSLVDIVAALIDSSDARKYWSGLKTRISKKAPELIERCMQVALPAQDGKRRMTDAASAQTVLDILKHLPENNSQLRVSFAKWLIRGREMHDIVWPLVSLPFEPGKALETIAKIDNEDMRQIAFAEYSYYTGDVATAANIAGLYLDNGEINVRLTAAFLYAFANISLNRTHKTMMSFQILKDALEDSREYSDEKTRLLVEMIMFSLKILMHLPAEGSSLNFERIVSKLPDGLKLWACYIRCHELYLNKEFEKVLGIVETASAFMKKVYPVPMGYLYAFAAVALINLRCEEEAKEYLDKAMALCAPDGLVKPFGELQILLQGLVDVHIKDNWPEQIDTIDKITNDFCTGWINAHNLMAEGNIALGLNKTEFIISMLASRDWRNREIAEYLGLSENTIKKYLSDVFEKLGIGGRKELKSYMMK